MASRRVVHFTDDLFDTIHRGDARAMTSVLRASPDPRFTSLTLPIRKKGSDTLSTLTPFPNDFLLSGDDAVILGQN